MIVRYSTFVNFLPVSLMLHVLAVTSSILTLGDEIRRVVMESVIPFVGELLARSKSKGRKVISDTTLAEYDQFDDYLEMVVQFGVSINGQILIFVEVVQTLY